MKLLAIALALTVFAGPAFAKDSWIVVAKTDTDTYSIKRGTFELKANKAGENIIAALGQGIFHKEGKVLIGKWYVRTSDCDAGYGKLVTLSTDGTYRFENDFAFGGESVASAKAEALCMVYIAYKKAKEKKDI